MLAISPTAAEAINGLVNAAEMPADAGLRISPAAGPSAPGFELELAPTPADEDAVVEDHGAAVFVAPDAAGELDDKLLDAEVEAGQVRFALLEPED